MNLNQLSYSHINQPFEWLANEIKGIHKNMWKDISKELPTFVLWVRCVVGEGRDTYFWEDH